MKLYTSIDELCQGCPQEFHKYMNYTKNLAFKEEPDYEFMKGLFVGLAKKENIDLHDNMYDWGVRYATIKKFIFYYDFIEN